MVSRGLFYCSNCGHQGIFRWVYTLDQVAYLLGSRVQSIRWAIKHGYMQFRYRLSGGKVDKVVTLPYFIQYIEERMPTPEALKSTNFNITMEAIARNLNWKKGVVEKRIATFRANLAKKKAIEEREQRRIDGRDEMG